MVYLLGKIEKVSSRIVYFTEITGLSIYRIMIDYYGAKHNFHCNKELIDKALFLHTNRDIVFIEIKEGIIVSMKNLKEEKLKPFLINHDLKKKMCAKISNKNYHESNHIIIDNDFLNSLNEINDEEENDGK